MRAVLEALFLIGGALTLFWFTWRGYLNLRRRQREDRHAEDAWLDDQLHKE